MVSSEILFNILLKTIYNWDAVHIIKTIGSSPFLIESNYLRASRFSSKERVLSGLKLLLFLDLQVGKPLVDMGLILFAADSLQETWLSLYHKNI